MATLKIWTDFSKRKNSTKQPTGGTDVEVKLKENTSIENPVFICNNLGNANYCQYGGNYYFVEDVVYVTNSVVELHCSMDAMATNKSAISGYTCFVERSQSAYDLWINDEMLSQKSTGVYTTGNEQSLSDAIDTDLGVYVVRTMGKNGITGHTMSKVTINDLMNFANDFGNFSDVFQGLDEIVDGAVKGLFNPDKWIVSCKWFPLKTSIMDLDSAIKVKLGNWESNVLAPVIRSPKVVINKTIALPTPIYNDFRHFNSSWTKIELYLPCIGTVELDPARYPNGVGIKYITDLYTGSLTVLLADADENVPIQQFTGMMGIDMPIGKAYENGTGIIGGMAGVGAIAGAGIGGLAVGALTPLGAPIALGATAVGAGAVCAGKAIKATGTPLQTSIGGTGTIATIQAMDKIRVGLFSYDTCEFVGTLGRPLMQMKQLGSLHGFVKCAGASLESVAYGKEKDIIDAYLNTGFYME